MMHDKYKYLIIAVLLIATMLYMQHRERLQAQEAILTLSDDIDIVWEVNRVLSERIHVLEHEIGAACTAFIAIPQDEPENYPRGALIANPIRDKPWYYDCKQPCASAGEQFPLDR